MPPWPYPRVLAHRCGGALAPENTLAGLSIAARLGCRGVEFDVMLSASGSPVLIHDETLERTTSGAGRVCDSEDAFLAQLDAGVRFHEAFAGTCLPTLGQAMAAARALNLAMNIEIKPAAGFERITGRVVTDEAARGSAGLAVPPLLSSFSEEALQAAGQAAPQLPRGWLVERLPADWPSRCERMAVVAVHTNSRYLDEASAQAIKSAGYRIVVYTENDPARAGMLWGWGVDTVVTDRPDILCA